MADFNDFIFDLARRDKKFALTTNRFYDDAIDIENWFVLTLDPIIDYSQPFEEIEDNLISMITWCSENCSGCYAFDIWLYFEKEADFVHFKLVWL